MSQQRQDLSLGAFASGFHAALNEGEMMEGVRNVREFMAAPYGPNVGKEMEERASRLMAQARREERLQIRADLLAYINAWGNGDPYRWGDEVQGDDLRAMVDVVAPEVRG